MYRKYKIRFKEMLQLSTFLNCDMQWSFAVFIFNIHVDMFFNQSINDISTTYEKFLIIWLGKLENFYH